MKFGGDDLVILATLPGPDLILNNKKAYHIRKKGSLIGLKVLTINLQSFIFLAIDFDSLF